MDGVRREGGVLRSVGGLYAIVVCGVVLDEGCDL
jgi:hypothetical protein